jgi:hypothetical protein
MLQRPHNQLGHFNVIRPQPTRTYEHVHTHPRREVVLGSEEDPQLVNAILPVGDCFWEIVSPARDRTSAGKYLDRFGTGPPGAEASGFMLEVQVCTAES